MANCNKQFKDYDSNLSIPSSKKTKMNESREAARYKLKDWFKENHPDYPISFWIQGSHKNSLNIRTEDDDCDQDDGIYIDRDPDESVVGTTLQEWIFEAIKDITTVNVEHKNRCIRNNYKPYNLGSYHIDYPSYYKTEYMLHPLLTVKNGDLEESDPQEFTKWLDEQTDDKGQLRRIIRYMKGWCHYKSSEHDMLNGLTLTVLICNNYVAKDARDDVALYETLLGIQTDLNAKWECIMPSTPNDDLLAGYNYAFQINFMNRLANLINDGKKALEESSEYEASKLWKEHMGTRYPLASREAKIGNRAALGAIVANNKPYFNGWKSFS